MSQRPAASSRERYRRRSARSVLARTAPPPSARFSQIGRCTGDSNVPALCAMGGMRETGSASCNRFRTTPDEQQQHRFDADRPAQSRMAGTEARPPFLRRGRVGRELSRLSAQGAVVAALDAVAAHRHLDDAPSTGETAGNFDSARCLPSVNRCARILLLPNRAQCRTSTAYRRAGPSAPGSCSQNKERKGCHQWDCRSSLPSPGFRRLDVAMLRAPLRSSAAPSLVQRVGKTLARCTSTAC